MLGNQEIFENKINDMSIIFQEGIYNVSDVL